MQTDAPVKRYQRLLGSMASCSPRRPVLRWRILYPVMNPFCMLAGGGCQLTLMLWDTDGETFVNDKYNITNKPQNDTTDQSHAG